MKQLKPRKNTEIPQNIDRVISQLFPEKGAFCPGLLTNEGFTPFTEEEILIAASKLRDKKSPGLDGIPAEVVIAAATTALKIFAQIFSDIVSCGRFPKKGKTAELRLILKEGHSKEMPKYRPICLIDTTTKLIEHTLNARITRIKTMPSLRTNMVSAKGNLQRPLNNNKIILAGMIPIKITAEARWTRFKTGTGSSTS